MNRTIYVVSLDDSLWLRAKTQAERLGFNVERIPGVPADSIEDHLRLIGHYPLDETLEELYGEDANTPERKEAVQEYHRKKKVAILRAMQHAAAHVAKQGGGIIMQEDVIWDEKPTIRGSFTVYSGGNTHYCPQAFYVDAEFAGRLAEAWKRETVNACDGWKQLVIDEASVTSIAREYR